MFKPKHTFESVAEHIADGLNTGTIVLNAPSEINRTTNGRMTVKSEHVALFIRKVVYVGGISCCIFGALAIIWSVLPNRNKGSEVTKGVFPNLDVRTPVLDRSGQFWVYKDGDTLRDRELELRPVPPYGIPYQPYAWMPIEAHRMMRMTLEHRDEPYEGDMCIAVSINWEAPYWCGVMFVSGPDKDKPEAPWWGQTPHGWYYNLSGLEKRNFVFYMRGEKGGERVQWKIGILGHEKYGDSLQLPASTKWLTLNTEWKQFEIELRETDISRVCSLGFVVSQAQQSDSSVPVTFYIDSIYFE